MKIFEKLFSMNKSGSSDGLTQEEREAIVDLLLLGAYTDNRLSLREEKAFDSITGTLNWESPTTLTDYMDASIAKIRGARNNPSATDGLLNKVKERIRSKPAIARSLKLLHQVFASDGRSYAEAHFYRKVESLLKN